jgi:hypothetical protein
MDCPSLNADALKLMSATASESLLLESRRDKTSDLGPCSKVCYLAESFAKAAFVLIRFVRFDS